VQVFLQHSFWKTRQCPLHSGITKFVLSTVFKDISEIPGYENKASTAVNLHYGVNHIKSDNNEQYLVFSKFEDGWICTNDYQTRVVNVAELPPYIVYLYHQEAEELLFKWPTGCVFIRFGGRWTKRQLKNVLKVWNLNRKTGIKWQAFN
jgi:hypothetical protein